jgi:uncharacterized protein YbjT (DUF2867 family)
MRVWMSGGTGFVGQAVTEALVAAGHTVTLLCHERRPPARAGVETVDGDVRSEGDWERSLEGQDAVVHLVAIIREWVARAVTFEALHVGATHRVLSAARRHGVRRFVHMSALGVGRCANARYFETKARAEAEVTASDLEWTVLRPSFVFAAASPFFQMMDGVARAPLVPVVGRGDVPIQPVALADVAQAVVGALATGVAARQVYEIGGPDVVTYRQMLDLLAGRRVRALHLSPRVVRLIAAALEASPAFPLTADQVAMLACPNVAADRRWQEDLGVAQPRSFIAWARGRAAVRPGAARPPAQA